jgi:hypothetical protein
VMEIVTLSLTFFFFHWSSIYCLHLDDESGPSLIAWPILIGLGLWRP